MALFGFEEVIVQVTYRECPLAHMRTIGLAGCLYGVIFNTSLLCNREITDGAHPACILYTILF